MSGSKYPRLLQLNKKWRALTHQPPRCQRRPLSSGFSLPAEFFVGVLPNSEHLFDGYFCPSRDFGAHHTEKRESPCAEVVAAHKAAGLAEASPPPVPQALRHSTPSSRENTTATVQPAVMPMVCSADVFCASEQGCEAWIDNIRGGLLSILQR